MPTTEERDALRIQRVQDLIERHWCGSLVGRTVLDLAAREGAFTMALAGRGARVQAVEGRAENIARWRQLPERGDTLVGQFDVVEGDVRHLGGPYRFDLAAGDGTLRQFDVVLCLGILYHLEPDDGRALLQNMGRRTRPGGIAIIDTHVGGHWQAEPGGLADPWGSIGNERSWWFDRDELALLLQAAGFALVQYLGERAYPDEPDSRAWFVATKDGRR